MIDYQQRFLENYKMQCVDHQIYLMKKNQIEYQILNSEAVEVPKSIDWLGKE